jgi:hypothetical protein
MGDEHVHVSPAVSAANARSPDSMGCEDWEAVRAQLWRRVGRS